MQKINVAHYKKTDANMYWNGGKILIYDTEVVLKNFFKRVAVFDKRTLEIKELLNDTMGYRVVEISDADKSFECMFFSKDFEKLENALLNYLD